MTIVQQIQRVTVIIGQQKAERYSDHWAAESSEGTVIIMAAESRELQ